MSSGSGVVAAARPPVSLTSLVGRERELRELGALVETQRLVTLTGVGGSGKTRVAAELALRIDWERADSVAWVNLAGCSDAMLVPHEVASAMGMRPMCERDAVVDALAAALSDRDLLLVLDNCEHVITACASLARSLLVRCPRMRILATSREPLHLPGEQVWPLPPIAQDDAIRLFVERAAAVDRRFALSPDNAAAVEEICRRLDGIPLAIELAAARIRVLTPAQISARLEDRFAVLTGAASADARHRTLRAAIDWSFDLLSPGEQRLLTHLTVFAGSFSLEAAESACDADLDLLSGLVDKSLVVATHRRAAVRYHLLETIRDYAAERLDAGGETETVRERHAKTYLDIARNATADPMAAVTTHLDALDAELDNIRAALSWSVEAQPETIALPLCAAFRWYWYYRILWGEGLRWSALALEKTPRTTTRDRATVLSGAGTFATYTGDLELGRRYLGDAESMWRALGDERDLALTLSAFSQLLANSGELDEAWGRATESIALARRSGTQWNVGYCLTNAVAFVAQRRDDLEEADRALEEAEAIFAPTRHPQGLPFVLSFRALLAVRRRDLRAADTFARSALVEALHAREPWFCARALRVLALTTRRDPHRAAQLLGASDAMLRTIGAGVPMSERSMRESVLDDVRSAIGPDRLEHALREGAAMTCDEACDFALGTTSCETRSEPLLRIGDLGPLTISVGEKALVADARASSRARELLAFLAVHSGTTKDEAGLAFWPDATAEQVKNSFHVTVHRLRKLLGSADAIAADNGRYTIAVPFESDSVRFEREMNTAMRRTPADVGALESAIALYKGDFLYGEDAGEWCLPIRARLRQLLIRGLFTLGAAHEARGRYAEAAEAYARALARDPFDEAAARQLMICRARLGARSESLLVYRQLEQRLRDDLQSAPEPETSNLYRRLRQNDTV